MLDLGPAAVAREERRKRGEEGILLADIGKSRMVYLQPVKEEMKSRKQRAHEILCNVGKVPTSFCMSRAPFYAHAEVYAD